MQSWSTVQVGAADQHHKREDRSCESERPELLQSRCAACLAGTQGHRWQGGAGYGGQESHPLGWILSSQCQHQILRGLKGVKEFDTVGAIRGTEDMQYAFVDMS